VATRRLRLTAQLDELLYLSHLHGVERIAYQVETVLAVLWLPRGRALLADEREGLAWVDNYRPWASEWR
jgi:hypothetical protein